MENKYNETQGLIEPATADINQEKYYEGSARERLRYSIAGVCCWLLVTCAAIMGAALLITVSVVDKSTTQSTGIMEYIEINIKTPLISDIQVTSNTTACGSGYTSMSLVQWPGTETGCFCDNLVFSDSIKKNACRKKQVGCSTIDAEPPKNLTNFEGSIFCVKYLQPSTDYVFTPSCSSGYTSCGPSLCVKNGLSCPLINVTYSSTTPSDLPPNTTSIQLNGGAGYLILQSGYSSTPLLNLQIEFNGAPCLSATQHPLKSTGNYYPLIESPPTGCGTYGTDNKSVFLTSYSEEGMYGDNGIPVNSVLKLYGQYLNGSVAQLYSRPRIEVQQNSYCNQLNVTMFQEATDSVEGIISNVKTCGLILLIGGGAATIILAVIVAKIVKSFSNYKVGLSIRWPIALVALGFISINVVMLAGARSNVRKLLAQKPALQELSDANCFINPMINQGATDFLSVPGKTIGIYYAVIVSLIVSILTSLPIVVVSGVYFRKLGFSLGLSDKM